MPGFPAPWRAVGRGVRSAVTERRPVRGPVQQDRGPTRFPPGMRRVTDERSAPRSHLCRETTSRRGLGRLYSSVALARCDMWSEAAKSQNVDGVTTRRDAHIRCPARAHPVRCTALGPIPGGLRPAVAQTWQSVDCAREVVDGRAFRFRRRSWMLLVIFRWSRSDREAGISRFARSDVVVELPEKLRTRRQESCRGGESATTAVRGPRRRTPGASGTLRGR